jgi:hypothetical protein
MHEFNRPLHENMILENSMKKHGFMPSGAIQVVKNSNGKMKVIRGHHRLHYAKRFNLPVWYIIDDSHTDLFDLEGASTGTWSLKDFVNARALAGDKGANAVVEFHKSTGIDLHSCCSLVGGESASSGNKAPQVKAGIFKIGDMTHAYKVAEVVDLCKRLNVEFATSKPFVCAISTVLRLPSIDQATLMHRLEQAAGIMMKRATRDAYLEELESVYNRNAKGKRVALAHEAKEAMRRRAAVKK